MSQSSSGRTVVFAGPSLPQACRMVSSNLDWRPPAMAGDAHALRFERPDAVILIDGLFDECPAIRHKELLQLIAEGVRVYGAASMGALRAAELHRYGMVGVGHIFNAYRRGLIDADDEVAVLHGPASFDWQPLTEPLVNIRATLMKAVRRGVISVTDGRVILRGAISIFYKERTWDEILGLPQVAASLPPKQRANFMGWLPTGYVDLKRIDAMASVIAAMSATGDNPGDFRPPPKTIFAEMLADQVDTGFRRPAGCL